MRQNLRGETQKTPSGTVSSVRDVRREGAATSTAPVNFKFGPADEETRGRRRDSFQLTNEKSIPSRIMSHLTRSSLQLLAVLAIAGILALAASPTSSGIRQGAADEPASAFTVDGRVALHSFVALSDAHLQKLADVLTIIAATDGVRSAEWERIRPALLEAARMNVPGAYWFSLPDGTYWTLDAGRVTANLSDRAYFPRLLAGQTVIGELVVSRSTNRNTTIVAVPVRGVNNAIVGALGCSVHLENLSTLIRREMGELDSRLLFFAIDAQPLGALNSDPSLIFTEPMKLGDEGMKQAFREILSGQEGVVRYNFRDSRRTVLYRKSPVTGWWYGFGRIEPSPIRGESDVLDQQ
jgi:methyl-accepting chemotaxis protein